MASRKTASQRYTKGTRDRIAREGAEKYGFTRRQSMERINRGTWNPLSRNPAQRVPQSVLREPEKHPRFVESLYSTDRDELVRKAISAYERGFGNDPFREYDPEKVADNIAHADDVTLIRLAGASEKELRAWARYQEKTDHTIKKTGKRIYTPSWIAEAGWTDSKGKWHNIAWYH